MSYLEKQQEMQEKNALEYIRDATNPEIPPIQFPVPIPVPIQVPVEIPVPVNPINPVSARNCARRCNRRKVSFSDYANAGYQFPPESYGRGVPVRGMPDMMPGMMPGVPNMPGFPGFSEQDLLRGPRPRRRPKTPKAPEPYADSDESDDDDEDVLEKWEHPGTVGTGPGGYGFADDLSAFLLMASVILVAFLLIMMFRRSRVF